MRQLRVGMVGLGVISRFYLAALTGIPSLRLAAVCDVDEALLAPFRDRVRCHRELREMLRCTELDAVVVAVPNDAHFMVCRDVLHARLPVCVEKPLAARLRDGEALVEAARLAGVPLFTAFHRRYNSAVVELIRRLPPALPVRSVVVRYLECIEEHAGSDRWELDPTRCGGGCVADNGPNAFDLARLLLGDVEVTDVSIRRDTQGIDRQARVELRAVASNATARVELDWSYEGERKDLEVQLVDGSTYTADLLAAHPGFKSSLWHEYVGVLKDFAGLLPPNNRAQQGDEGLAALALVDATYRCERLQRSRKSSPLTRRQP